MKTCSVSLRLSICRASSDSWRQASSITVRRRVAFVVVYGCIVSFCQPNVSGIKKQAPAFPVSLLSFFVLGALVAGDLRLSPRTVSLVAIAVGLIHGFGNGVAFKSGSGVPGLLGIMVMLFVLVSLVSASVVSLERNWMRIAVRVAGSWVCASGLLMFGWTIRGLN